jgi:hypothetical protein
VLSCCCCCSNAGETNPIVQCDAGGDMFNPEISTLLRAAGDIVDESGGLAISSWTPKDNPMEHFLGGQWGLSRIPMQVRFNSSSFGVGTHFHWATEPVWILVWSLNKSMTYTRRMWILPEDEWGMYSSPIEIQLFGGGPFEFCPSMTRREPSFGQLPKVKR